MDSIHAIREILGISPEMMVRSVLGVSSGRSGGFGPVALFALIMVTAVVGRYLFVIVMTHLRPTNPFASMGRGQLILMALVFLPAASVGLSGTGPVKARIDARVLEPLGLARRPVLPVEEDAVQASGCSAAPDPRAEAEPLPCLSAPAGPETGGPAPIRPTPRPAPRT